KKTLSFEHFATEASDRKKKAKDKLPNNEEIIPEIEETVPENKNTNIKPKDKKDLKILKKEENKSNEKKDLFKDFDISDYLIVTQIGFGAFGKVFLVRNKHNDQLYGMKKIITSDDLYISNIIKECEISKQFDHKNLVKIYGLLIERIDEEKFVLYILMDIGLYDWAKEIEERMESNDYYTEEELRNILTQLCDALFYLQKMKVTHRDIKPQNIIIFKNNVYKIADYGEIKYVNIEDPFSQINTLRGTDAFMSPLLYNGVKTNQLDIRHNLFKSDVFSLGICIFFAASFNGKTLSRLRHIFNTKSLHEFIDSIIGKYYSKELVGIIKDMLIIDENERPDFIELKKKISSTFK
ncbi:MAG: protein kinase, partial [archaeon]|nr:protein kinase [archaeon]